MNIIDCKLVVDERISYKKRLLRPDYWPVLDFYNLGALWGKGVERF